LTKDTVTRRHRDLWPLPRVSPATVNVTGGETGVQERLHLALGELGV
jgi:hypothetical protein